MPIWVKVEAALAMPRQKKCHLTLAQRLCAKRTKKYTVYVLVDPADRGIRYVGVTTMTIEKRLAFHLKKPTNAGMRAWLADLARRGLRPEAVRLEVVMPDEWEAAERGWIHWCRTRGDLLNVDRGGQARTKTGALRPFVAGEYQAPTGAPRPKAEAMSMAVKVSQVGPKAPRGGTSGLESKPVCRPRLVPVATGVFRRA